LLESLLQVKASFWKLGLIYLIAVNFFEPMSDRVND